jgi:hypothetical protein
MLYHRSPRTYLAPPPTAELELQPPRGRLRIVVAAVSTTRTQLGTSPQTILLTCVCVMVQSSQSS